MSRLQLKQVLVCQHENQIKKDGYICMIMDLGKPTYLNIQIHIKSFVFFFDKYHIYIYRYLLTYQNIFICTYKILFDVYDDGSRKKYLWNVELYLNVHCLHKNIHIQMWMNYINMYVYIYIYIHICVRIYMYVCGREMWSYQSWIQWMSAGVLIKLAGLTRRDIRAYKLVCVYIYICIYKHIYIYIYT